MLQIRNQQDGSRIESKSSPLRHRRNHDVDFICKGKFYFVYTSLDLDAIIPQDELYSYARNEAETYLTHHWQSDEIKEISRDLQNIEEFQDFSRVTNLPDDIDANVIAEFVVYLINKDLKVKPLKTLQGFMWKEGYKAGALKGQ